MMHETLDIGASNRSALQSLEISLRWCDAITTCTLGSISSLDTISTRLTSIPAIGTDIRDNSHLRLTAAILRIAELEAWKRTAVQGGCLSVVELVKRAGEIESLPQSQSLVSIAAEPFARPSQRPPVSQSIMAQLLEIFTRAALVHLHVIVAGAGRKIPEICAQVQEAVRLFVNVSAVHTLVHFAWPFCVVGCLAVGDDRKQLMGVLNSASRSGTGAQRLARTKVLVEECWRLFDEEKVLEADWTVAINSLGNHTLI